MTIMSLLIFLVVFAVFGYLAYYVITKFIPAPARMPALAVVGILLLIILLAQFVPEAGNYRIWH